MLVLTRKFGESIIISDHIKLTITDIRGDRVRIGIDAPREVGVLRGELVGAEESAKGTTKREPRRILIVDDDRVDRRVIRRCLTTSNQHRFTFFESPMGNDGLTYCKNDKPDCVVLDYCLPDIDGVEFLNALRNNDVSRDIPVIMVSGKKDIDRLGESAMQNGAHAFLDKRHLSPKSLQAAVNEAIRVLPA